MTFFDRVGSQTEDALKRRLPIVGKGAGTFSFVHVEDVIEDIRRHGARKLIFVDLNLIADHGYAIRLFMALAQIVVDVSFAQVLTLLFVGLAALAVVMKKPAQAAPAGGGH